MSRPVLILCCVLVAGCKKAPAPPSTGSPAEIQTINGTERLGWNQPAANSAELSVIAYALYVDGARREVAPVSCADVAGAGGFTCSAALPALTAGSHTLELAAFIADGAQVLESGRSPALRVSVIPAITVSVDGSRAWNEDPIVTSDGLWITPERIAGGFEDITDLAFAPDGRLFVAERAGSIRIVRDGALEDEPAIILADELGSSGQLLAIAVDPAFDRTGHLFAIYTSDVRSDEPVFTLARLRAVGNSLGDRVVLLDGVRAGTPPHALLRFGPDRMIYAAFDDAGETEAADDMGSFNGKVLRLDADGTTPDDQSAPTPIYAHGLHAPRGIAWDPRSGLMWMADAVAGANARLLAGRGVYWLPAASIPSSLVFGTDGPLSAFANNLLIGSDAGRHLLRLSIAVDATSQPIARDQMLQDVVGPVRTLAIKPGGDLYFSTGRAIGRLSAHR
jgi:glucose/arabinose dehydrogenase